MVAPSKAGLKKIETKHKITAWWEEDGARHAFPAGTAPQKYFVVKGKFERSPNGRELDLDYYIFTAKDMELQKRFEIARKVDGTLVKALGAKLHIPEKEGE